MMNFYNYHTQTLDLHDLYGESLSYVDSTLMYTHDLTPIHHIIKTDIRISYGYAHHNLRGRFIEAEPYIMKHPKLACLYAERVIKDRWLEAEPYIMQDPNWAVEYAESVIRGRWIEAEPHLMKKPVWWQLYKDTFKV